MKSARLTRAAPGGIPAPAPPGPEPARPRPAVGGEGSAPRSGADRSLRPPGARRPAAPRPWSAGSRGAGPGRAGERRGTEAGTARESVPSPRPRWKALLSCLQFSLFTFTLETLARGQQSALAFLGGRLRANRPGRLRAPLRSPVLSPPSGTGEQRAAGRLHLRRGTGRSQPLGLPGSGLPEAATGFSPRTASRCRLRGGAEPRRTAPRRAALCRPPAPAHGAAAGRGPGGAGGCPRSRVCAGPFAVLPPRPPPAPSPSPRPVPRRGASAAPLRLLLFAMLTQSINSGTKGATSSQLC